MSKKLAYFKMIQAVEDYNNLKVPESEVLKAGLDFFNMVEKNLNPYRKVNDNE